MTQQPGIPPWVLFTSKGQLPVGIAPGLGELLPTGTSGQVLSVGGADPSGLQWVGPAASVESGFTAAGQLYAGTGNGTGELLAKGSAGTVLTVGGADASGLEWVVPPGAIIGFKRVAAPNYSVNSGTFSCVDSTNAILSGVIIPPSGNVLLSVSGFFNNGVTGAKALLIFSDGTTNNTNLVGTNMHSGIIDQGIWKYFETEVTGLTPGSTHTFAIQWAYYSTAGTITLGSAVDDVILKAVAL